MKKNELTFVDLFCGGGLASSGLINAGLRHVAGVDNWYAAIESYRSNGLHGINAAVPFCNSDYNLTADVVWASPPCTEFSNGSNNRPKRESVKMLSVKALEMAEQIATKAIVIENHPKLCDYEPFRNYLLEMHDRGWKYTYRKIDAANYGAFSHRNRVYFVIVNSDRANFDEAELLNFGSMNSRDVSSVVATFEHKRAGDWRKIGVQSPMMEYFNSRPENKYGFLFSYYSPPIASPFSKPARTITTVARVVACFPDFKYYWLKSDDYRKLMNVPDWLKFTGSQKDIVKMIGNGVNPLMSERIGRNLIETL